MTELERYKEAVRVAREELGKMMVSWAMTPACREQATCIVTQINTIINPPPVYEDVTVERWVCNTCDKGGMSTAYKSEPKICSYSSEDYNCNGKEFTKLTGTRRVQVAQKVERSVSVEARVNVSGDPYGFLNDVASCIPFHDRPETHGKTGTLTFTWEE